MQHPHPKLTPPSSLARARANRECAAYTAETIPGPDWIDVRVAAQDDPRRARSTAHQTPALDGPATRDGLESDARLGRTPGRVINELRTSASPKRGERVVSERDAVRSRREHR